MGGGGTEESTLPHAAEARFYPISGVVNQVESIARTEAGKANQEPGSNGK